MIAQDLKFSLGALERALQIVDAELERGNCFLCVWADRARRPGRPFGAAWAGWSLFALLRECVWEPAFRVGCHPRNQPD
jgi:hypothetical protein